ncbi:MAG: hypothetical protein ACLQBJ_05300 [Bryobacteraceae bacterium]
MAPLLRAELRAGSARVSITPRTPIRLGGRDALSEGLASQIYARALALDDGAGGRAVIIATDLLGLPRSLTERAAVEIMKAQGLERGQILFTATGTHNAPQIKGLQPVLEPESGSEAQTIEHYAETLVHYLSDAAGAAIGDLKPARVDFAWGGAGLKSKKSKEAKQSGRDSHDLAVLRVLSPKGGLIAVLFATSTGNAVIGGDFRAISGDAAGEAEAALEKEYKGSVAMNLRLCAGSATQKEGSDEQAAQRSGADIAARVDQMLKGPMHQASGRLRSAFIETALPFVAHTKEQFEQEAAGPDGPAARRGRRMLAAYEARNEPRQLPYPVQVVRFDEGLALVGLGGEVAAEVAGKIRKLLHDKEIMVVGNCNDGTAVVSGAVEPRAGEAQRMLEYGHPGPFTGEAEQRVLDAAQRAWKRSGRR